MEKILYVFLRKIMILEYVKYNLYIYKLKYTSKKINLVYGITSFKCQITIMFILVQLIRWAQLHVIL